HRDPQHVLADRRGHHGFAHRAAAPPKQITPAGWSVNSASLSADGQTVYFLSAKNGSQQLYAQPLNGGTPRQLTDFAVDVDSYHVSPQDDRVLFSAGVFQACASDLACTEKKLKDVAGAKASGKTREIAPQWDRSAGGITLSADGASIYTTADDLGEHPLFQIDVASGKATKLIGDGSVTAVDVAGNSVAITRNSLKSNDQVLVGLLPAAGQAIGELRALTPAAGDVLKDVSFGDYEQFEFKGWNNDTVHGYVVKPHNYQEGKSYPVAFLIHGGPQGSFGNGWSYRWNPQTYAGQGYAVVMIDFHGSTGYGQAFTDAISQHWGDRPLEDLQKGWDAALKKYSFLNGDKACALGASYGGFMVNWIAGNWNGPFKCLVNH
ncbi:prolyl oligopeptidase family serine peptidase, partial [Pantoea endophytica]